MFSPLILPDRALINGTFLTWNFEEKKQTQAFSCRLIEWQTIVILPYKWLMMIDEYDTIWIWYWKDRLSVRFCLQLAVCFLMFSVTFWCSVSNCWCSTCSRRRCCTWKVVWQRWIGRRLESSSQATWVIKSGDLTGLTAVRPVTSPVHRSLANPNPKPRFGKLHTWVSGSGLENTAGRAGFANSTHYSVPVMDALCTAVCRQRKRSCSDVSRLRQWW